MRANRGYTLLEVLVATLIMAVAVVALLSNLSTSLNNAARLTDYDRASLVAERVMNDLLVNRSLPPLRVIQEQWDAQIVGVPGGWRARITPFQVPPPGQTLGMERVELEVWWMNGGARRTFTLEGYRTAQLTREERDFARVAR